MHDQQDGELWRLDASDISSRYATGRITPEAVTIASLERCRQINEQINAVVALDEDGAIAAGVEATHRQTQGGLLGPLDGVPVVVKDNLFVAGLPATWGSRLFADFVPRQDDFAVARLRQAGAVILGKANTPEFALASHTQNLLFGATRNPWRLQLTPGGSSGGPVAAVASGMAPLALATDAGGSIRRPASYTGLVGLKPSIGRVPRVHGFPNLAADFQTVGPIARSVAAARAMLTAIAGPTAEDRASWLSVRSRGGGGERSLAVAALGEIDNSPVDSAIREAFAASLEILRGLGHKAERVAAPFDLAELDNAFKTLASVGIARTVGQLDRWRDMIDEGNVKIVETGLATSATDYVRALDWVAEFRREIDKFFARWDLLATPTAAAMPWPVDTPYPETIDGRKAGPRASAVFTTFVNAGGLPAITVSAAASDEGLPIGLQIVGPYGSERRLLDLAEAFERARGWTPPLPVERPLADADHTAKRCM